MNINKYLFTSFVLLVPILSGLVSVSFAQNNVEFYRYNFKDDKLGFKEAIKNLEDGDYYYAQGGGAYRIALEYYLNANKFNPDNAELNYKLGVCYLHSIEKVKSIAHLKKAYKLDKYFAGDIHYKLGQGYHLNYEFDKAIKEYNLYKRTLLPKELKKWQPIISKRIKECKHGKEFVNNPEKVVIENIGDSINSSFPDYRPFISADESMMLFTSRRDNTTGSERDPFDHQYFEDIYISYNINGTWQKAQNIGKPLNTPDHDAVAGLTADGQKLFFYDGRKKGGDIFICKLRGDQWSPPIPLPETINTDFRESSASFSYDGKKLYFVSDKIDYSKGGRDIYVSRKYSKGGWGKPKNLGSVINTQYEEASIFMHPDGRTMYFSSQGHNSMGGFDIFKTKMNKAGRWLKPVNLGYPINTPDDDVFFVLSASGKHGYYSSAKKGGYGEKDIYMISFLSDSIAKPDSDTAIVSNIVYLTILKGTVKDAVTLNPVEAKIEIVDNEKNEVISIATSNSITGKYLVSLPSGKNYGIAVTSEGYLFHSENFNIPETKAYQEVIKNILLNKITVGSKIILNNIFFDFAEATLHSESIAELNRVLKLLKNYTTIKIEISGHTDNKGTMELNTTLSGARAKAVVDYLIENGIDSTRLEYKGYAFSQPIASNDTDEGRQLNRRVEFKIISK